MDAPSPQRALLDAVERLDARGVERALALGADPLAEGPDGFTPLLSIVHSPHPSARPSTPERLACARALLPVSDLGFVFERHAWRPSLLAAAIYSAPAGDVDLILALLDAGARDAPGCGLPSLVMAALTRRIDCASELLARGVDPLSRDECGRDALMHAAQSGDLLLAELLAESCDPLAVDSFGMGAADYASANRTAARIPILDMVEARARSARDALAIARATLDPASASLRAPRL